MAELRVRVITDRSQFDSDIQNIEKLIDRLENKPLQIKVEATGVDKVSNSVIRLARAQADAAKAAAQAATAQSKLAIEQERTNRASIQASTGASKLASATEDLGNANARAVISTNTLIDSFLRFQVIDRVANSFRDALSTMRAVDDELVTIRKVTGATASELEQLTAEAYEMGGKYGLGADDFLSNVAEFSRAGYKDAADELGELAVKTQLVGDMSQSTATKMLLSVDAAYEYQGSIEKLNAVLDGMNEIDNNFATSMEKISAGLGKVAPIASQAHVDVGELSAALGTITAVTQRSGEEAATALRALFLNIMGDTKTEIEDGAKWTAGEIEGLRDVLEKYAPAAVEAARATGEVINPMEAIGGLAQSMKDGLLTEQQLMQMVSDIGGKLRSSQLLALIQHWDMYNSMLSSFGNSVGSADREVSNALDSWSVKAERLGNSMTKLVASFLDTKAVKGGLDFITAIVDGMDSGVGKVIAFTGAVSGLYAALSGLGRSQTLNTLMNFLSQNWPVVAIAAAVGTVYQLYDALHDTTDELKAQADEAKTSYSTQQKALDDINLELEEQLKLISQLEGKDGRTAAEEKTLELLKQQTEELRIQQMIQNNKTKQALEDAVEASVKYAKSVGAFDDKNIIDYRADPVRLADEDEIESHIAYYEHVDDLLKRAKADLATTASELETAQAEGNQKYADDLSARLTEMAEDVTYYEELLSDTESVLLNDIETMNSNYDILMQYFKTLGFEDYKDVISNFGLPTDEVVVWTKDMLNAGRALAFFREAKENALNALPKDKENLNNAGDAAEDFGKNAEQAAAEAEKLKAQLSDLADDASGFSDEISNAAAALSALQEKLKSTGETGDTFRDYQEAYQTALELFEKGMIGSREFQGITDLLLGDDIMRELGWNYEEAGRMIGSEFFQAMFGGGEDDYGKNALKYLTENYEELVDENGKLIASFKKSDDGVQIAIDNFEALADELGVSEDALMTVFDALDIWTDELSVTADDVQKLFDSMGDSVSRMEGNMRVVDFDAFVKSLAEMGKSEKDINKLYKAFKDMPDVKFEGDTEDVTNKIQTAVEEANSLTGEPHEVVMTANAEQLVGTVDDQALPALAKIPASITVPISATFSGISGMPGFLGLFGGKAAAKGTKGAEGGPTLVNELGPEIISQDGKAFIANEGKPAVVDLKPGAIVLTADETKQVKNAGLLSYGEVGAAAFGLGSIVSGIFNTFIPNVFGNDKKETSSKKNKKNSSSSSGGYSGGGSSEKEVDYWDVIGDYYDQAVSEAERAIDKIAYQIELLENELEDLTEPLDDQIDALDRLNDQMDRQIELLDREKESLTKPIEDRIQAMRDEKELQDEQLDLEERQKAVEEARAQLQNAQNERNIRYFNAEKGQWEWMADQKAVQSAEESLANAEKALEDQKYQMQISALERERDEIEKEFDAKVSALEEKQLENDDVIYELEQKILELEDLYNAAIKPLEREQTEQERALEAFEQQWADIELKTEKIEGNLQDALNRVSGTEEGKLAAGLLEDIQNYNAGLIEAPMSSIWQGNSSNVPTLDGVIGGIMAGSTPNNQNTYATTTNNGNVYNSSNSNNTYYINGIKVEHPNAGSMTLDELISTGIYANMDS